VRGILRHTAMAAMAAIAAFDEADTRRKNAP
jgi:hypothetical protein